LNHWFPLIRPYYSNLYFWGRVISPYLYLLKMQVNTPVLAILRVCDLFGMVALRSTKEELLDEWVDWKPQQRPKHSPSSGKDRCLGRLRSRSRSPKRNHWRSGRCSRPKTKGKKMDVEQQRRRVVSFPKIRTIARRDFGRVQDVHHMAIAGKSPNFPYCSRNPAPVEAGSLSHYFEKSQVVQDFFQQQ